MGFPASLDSYTPVQGTTSQSSADHANMHNVAGSAIVNLETKVGLSAGSPVNGAFLTGTGNGTSAWLTLGTLNNFTFGTPAITGGTANNQVLGTPSITGGTVSSGTFTGGITLAANGSITQTGAADHVTLTPGANKLVRLATLQQDNTSNTYKTTQAILTGNGFKQGTGTPILNQSVTFGGTFAAPPIVFANYAGNNSHGAYSYPPVNGENQIWAIASNIGTAGFTCYMTNNSGNFSTASDYYFTWMAIGSMN